MWYRTRKARPSLTRHRLLTRCLALAAVPALAVSAAPPAQAATPAQAAPPAQAATPAAAGATQADGLQWRSIPCSETRGLQWDHFVFNPFNGSWDFEYYEFSFMSAEPTFDVSDRRFAFNDLDTPVSVTFTSQKSQTWTITVAVQAQWKYSEVLNINVTTTFAYSRTTQINVAVTAMVPPHTTVHGEYGLSAFNVRTLDRVVKMHRRPPSPFPGFPDTCWEGYGAVTRNVPTTDEGWRITM